MQKQHRRLRALAVGAVLIVFVASFSVDYTVERGDTLSKIAKEQGVALSDLIEANNISNPDLIRIGQILTIPGESGDDDIVHVVKRGDTLAKIAAQYGASVSALVTKNGIANPNLILIGQSVIISDADSPPPASNGSDEEASATSDPYVRSGRYAIVRRGEGVQDVASRLDLPVEQIVRANGIVGGVIYPGQRLFADGPSYILEETRGETTYVVRTGDTLSKIASRQATTVAHLAKLNNLTNPNLIRSGQTLRIPGGSNWVCPVENARFINSWGFPRGGGTRYHEGLDLMTSQDAPIYAPVAGVLTQKTGSIGGKQFNLDGDDGAYYIGSHMSDFGKSGPVNAGDIIGYAGTTGNAAGTTPHLHFAMYLDGIPVNSYPTLVSQGCK